MGNSFSRATLVCAFAVHAQCTSFARADVKSDLYDDAKTIIKDLITKEVAENTVPEIACRAGHVRLDGPSSAASVITFQVGNVTEYYDLEALAAFPGTMRRIYGAQFGGLKSTLVAEASDYAGFLVYQVLKPGSQVKQYAQQVTTELIDRANAHLKAEQDLTIQQLDVKVSAKQIPDHSKREAFVFARLQAESGAKIADTAGLDARLRVAGGATAVVISGIDANAYGALRDGRHGKCKTAVLAKLKAGLQVTPSRLDDQCDGAADTGAHFACEVAKGVRSTIRGEDKSAREHFLRAFMVLVDSDRTDELVTAILNVAVDPAAIEQLRKVFAELKLNWDTYAKLIKQWRMLLVSDTRLDLAQLRALVKTTYRAVCEGTAQQPELCQQLKLITEGGQVRALRPLLEAALRGDLHETVHLAIDLVLAHTRSTEACDEVNLCTKSLYERFFESLAFYALEAATQRGNSEDTRAAFRSAAEDVIRHQWPGGYQRGGYWGFRIRPDFALRASWNEGYVSPNGSSYRSIAAIPWLLWRYPVYYTNVVYLGVHASALDLLAPLAELTLRPNKIDGTQSVQTNWDDSHRAWANVVAPRASLELGLPALSNHLLVDLGASLRPVVAYPVTATMDPLGNPVPTYRYLAPWHDGARWSRSLELSLSLKYAP